MMLLLSTISEALLYTCFALLMGSYIFSLIPSSLKPKIVVPIKYKLIAVAGIIIFSFMPALSVLGYLVEDYSLFFALKTMLLTFEVGKAWTFTVIMSVILTAYILLFDRQNARIYSFIGGIFVVVLIIGVGWTSHAHSVYGLQGLITHIIHFATVIIWVGILLVVSWFSKDKVNWLRFLSWFHITALCCFSIVIITGLFLMNFAMEWNEYPNSWMIPYGKILLIKHLLIIPLIGYACINGVFMKKKLKTNANIDPRPWTKLEFTIILLIFVATGAMSQQQPPYSYSSILSLDTMLVMNVEVILLLLVSVIFFIFSIISFFRKMPTLFSFIMSVFAVISGYVALILSIQIN